MVAIDVEPIRERSTVAPFLDERGRRLVAAAEAFAAGYGGITAVATATGMAPSTIGRGLRELARRTNLRNGFGGRGRDASRRSSRTRHWFRISRRWSNRRRGGIRRRRCGGPARACDASPESCSSRATRQAVLWSANCSMPPVAVCKETARPRRATATPTGMHNSPRVAAALAEQQPVISVDTK